MSNPLVPMQPGREGVGQYIDRCITVARELATNAAGYMSLPIDHLSYYSLCHMGSKCTGSKCTGSKCMGIRRPKDPMSFKIIV